MYHKHISRYPTSLNCLIPLKLGPTEMMVGGHFKQMLYFILLAADLYLWKSILILPTNWTSFTLTFGIVLTITPDVTEATISIPWKVTWPRLLFLCQLCTYPSALFESQEWLRQANKTSLSRYYKVQIIVKAGCFLRH